MEGLEQVFGSSYNPGSKQLDQPRNELGQEDFFRLMVAQLNNQDPTKPLDNAEFLGQLAQSSTVSGIDDMNESFGGLVNNFFTSQAMMAAQLIGREVLTEAGPILDAFFTPGEELLGGIIAENPTEDARVTIYDGSGNLINSIALGDIEAGSHQFAWNGAVKGGGEAELGKYLIVAEGWVDGGLTSLAMQQYREVTSVSVDRQNTSVLLQLDNGEDVKFSQVNEFK
jgi:flagellar basal-body rod modification protein FlgD